MQSISPIIQIAGIIDREDAATVLHAGATHLGFPLRLDVHAEDLTETAAAEIIRSLPDPGAAVLITYLKEAHEIIGLAGFLGCSTVQLHGDIDLGEILTLKKLNPQLKVWKSLVVKSGNSIELEKTLVAFEPFVDAFITDTFDPATGATGATGKTHDPGISRRLAALSKKPVILAGGLTPENVYKAITTVKPAGVDAHTHLEDSSGRKDPVKCRKFVAEARRGFIFPGK